MATKRAAILLACYRKGEAEDPETYSAAVASILASYPLPVVYRVTDPRSGLPGKSQWLPTVAEVKAACEAEMAPARAQAAREQRREQSMAVLASRAAEHDRVASMARLKAIHPRVFAGTDRRVSAPVLSDAELKARFDCAGVRLSEEARSLIRMEPK